MLLASASYDQTIRLWDVTSGKLVSNVPHPEAQVNSMALVPKSSQLAVGTWQKVRLFDLTSSQPGQGAIQFDNLARNVTSVGFESHANWLFTGGEDGFCRVFDFRGSHLSCQRSLEVPCALTSVVLHCNQVELFLADISGAVYIWDLTKDSHERIDVPSFGTFEFVVRLAMHPKGHLLSGITNRGNLVTWSLAQWEMTTDQGTQTAPGTHCKVISFLNVHDAHGLSVRYTNDGRHLIITFSDDTILLIHSEDYEDCTAIKADCDWNWDAIVTCDNKYFFTGGADNKVKLWDMERAQVVTSFEGHQKPITAICTSEGV